MRRSRKSSLIAYGSRDWFRRVGEIVLSLGSAQFYEDLIDVFGCLIDHDACWVICFSDPAPPEVMFTRNVPQALRDHYTNTCSAVDPFAAHWRLHKEVGVRTLSKFKGMLAAIDARQYNDIFKPAANITDEMGLFLPTIGASSIGLFLERQKGDFNKDELERAKAAFPILSSLARAHIGQLFDGLRQGDGILSNDQIGAQPILVQDRCGVEIFSSASWKNAVEQEPDLANAIQLDEREAPILLGSFVLNVARVDKYFPLAPGGRMLTLTRCPTDLQGKEVASRRMELMRCLTPRERDVFGLIFSGCSTSEISRALSLSKGSAKNVTLRIYKKSQCRSRIELIRKYSH